MSTVSPAFFSSVRTSSDLKEQTEVILKGLGLSWSAFINNAARKLVQEKKVEFSLHDASGFSPKKGKELQDALLEIKNKKNITKVMTLKDSQDFLSDL